MISIFKYLISFAASFIILSIPVQDKPLFDHFSKIFEPYTKSIFSSIKYETKVGFEKSKELGKKYIVDMMEDNVKKRVLKPLDKKISSETFTVEERELLNRILKENQ